MPRPRKPCKPIVPGDALKLIQHNAKVRAQIADEDARHRAKLLDLSDREHEIQISNIEGAVRAARLIRIVHQRAEEMRRHHAALNHLKQRIR